MYRMVFTIKGDCEIYLQKTRDNVRIRVCDDPNSTDPADFELEGTVDAVRELVATLNSVMEHCDAITEEMN